VLAWGADPEQAVLRLELVEHLATIAVTAAPLGGLEPLPESAFAPLLAARAKANLGRAGDRAVTTAAQLLGAAPSSPSSSSSWPRAVVACAPAPHADVPTIGPGGESIDHTASPSGDAATRGQASGRDRCSATARPTVGTSDLASVVREEIVRALRGQ
jgi:hypothetical protein